MDLEDSSQRLGNPLEQTSSSLNNTNDFMDVADEHVEKGFDETQLLDEPSRELLKFAFKKMAKKNDFIRMEELSDAFRHAGQNPPEDVIKDMVEKAKALKSANQTSRDDDQTIDQLTYPDFLTAVHEYWYPIDEDRQQLEEAFDVLDPKRTAKLMVDDFTTLLRSCDWPDDEIELIMSQVSCGDGYFLYDDLSKLLLTPVELPKKKSATPKSDAKKKKK